MSNQYNDLLVSQMSEPLDAEKNSALFERVSAGDAAAREEMIVGNMPLAVAKVESFLRCFPGVAHLRDDLTSAAFVGLTKAVNQMAEGKAMKYEGNWNPTDCIGAWINRELGELIEAEGLVPPHTSQHRAHAQGKELAVPTVIYAAHERFEVASDEEELETRRRDRILLHVRRRANLGRHARGGAHAEADRGCAGQAPHVCPADAETACRPCAAQARCAARRLTLIWKTWENSKPNVQFRPALAMYR